MGVSSNVRAWIAAVAAALALGAAFSAGCGGDNGSTTDGGSDATSSSCGSGSSLCGGTCVSTQNDNANCGSCGNACTNGEVCSQGKCAASCGGGTKLCGSICADTKNDPQNCGGCGTKCAAGEICSAGACANTCSSGQTFCGGDGGAPYCASTKTDNANCGGCGVTCGAGQVCESGACQSGCGGDDAGAETLCTPDGGLPYCASTTSDNANCGACGNACGAGEVCQNGACSNACASSDGGVETLCTPDAGAAYCASIDSDNQNCGACGNACALGTKCIGSTCQPFGFDVAVEGGSFYTDDIRAALAAEPGIASATQITACDLATLQKYDVVIVYGNMTCFNNAAYTSYVNGGGGLVGTPWIFANNSGITALPVTKGGTYVSHYNGALDVTVTDASDPLLAGVTFNTTDSVGHEEFAFTLNSGATSSSYWNDPQKSIATAKWTYGSGRAVYLDFHYITSDCDLAGSYAWGKQLMYNAVLWAARR